MIETRLAVILLAIHWTGDFVLQFNIIAARKGVSVKWLAMHVLLYASTLFIAALFLAEWSAVVPFVLYNAIAHFVIDLGTSQLTKRWKDDARLFYLTIGFDQFLHTTILIITASLLL